MKEEEEEASSTMDPWSLFFYGIKAPITRQKYRGRLAKFFDFVGLTEGTMEERAKTFTEKGKKQPALYCDPVCNDSRCLLTQNSFPAFHPINFIHRFF
jgi:hypothetical protein